MNNPEEQLPQLPLELQKEFDEAMYGVDSGQVIEWGISPPINRHDPTTEEQQMIQSVSRGLSIHRQSRFENDKPLTPLVIVFELVTALAEFDRLNKVHPELANTFWTGVREKYIYEHSIDEEQFADFLTRAQKSQTVLVQYARKFNEKTYGDE